MSNIEKKERLIVGIGHKARQGKDTAAEHLEEKYNCKVIHFADALYEECRNAEILYCGEDNIMYLKTREEKDYYKYINPPASIIEWIKNAGEMKNGLEYNSEYYYGGMKEKDGNLLQFWGTEYRRKNFGWDYWVNIVKDVILSDPEQEYMIPDARFQNEAQMIKDLGGIIWRIIRPGFVAKDRDPNHKSEVDLDDWEFDLTIINDGTIADLHNKAEIEYCKMKGLTR